jgi:hypothetical protein
LFVKGLSSFLDSRHKEPLLARGSNQRRQLRIPFSHSADLYFQIVIQKEKLLVEGLKHSENQKWASKCPRCFGPQVNEQKANPCEPDFIVAMDGNFQQRHYAHASKDNPSDQQYPPIFLSPSLVNTKAAEVEATDANVDGITVCVVCFTMSCFK